MANYSCNQQENDEMVTDFVNNMFRLSEPVADHEFVCRQVSRALKTV
ncbi:MAG: hypothetical protein GY737_09245 [Desulfobacteraceae bacterium]|nr:hypothetical protein [Desulfobacteraceae bacterium]